MIECEKTPVDKDRLVLKIIWAVLTISIGLGLMIWSISECIHFREVQKVAVTLDATVSEVRKSYDGEGNTEYMVYVEYDYNGNHYTELHTTTSRKAWLNRVGEKLRITINPDDPTEELDDIIDTAFFTMLFGIPVFACGCIWIGVGKHRFSWVEMQGMRDSAIRQDLMRDKKWNRVWLWPMLTGLGYVCFGLWFFDINASGAAAALFGVVFTGIALHLIIKDRKLINANTDDVYRVQEYIVSDKRISSDSDGLKQYEVLLKSENEEFWLEMKKKMFNGTSPGEKMHFVSCGGTRLRYKYNKETGHYEML